MNKRIIINSFFAILILLIVAGCKKYDDGPLLSMYSKAERMSGMFTFHKITQNDTVTTADYNGQYIQFTKNGEFYWFLETDTVTYEQKANFGIWEFTNDKERIYMEFYNDTSIMPIDWKINRLTYSDVWLEATTEDGWLEWELARYR